MENQIIQVVSRMSDLALSSFKNHIEDAKGDFDFLFPIKGGKKSNILLISGVSKEFIEAINKLITNQIITFDLCSFFVVNSDGGEWYDLPLAEGHEKSYKSLHWLPLLIKKGVKFPKL
jgi:hypothetical protein